MNTAILKRASSCILTISMLLIFSSCGIAEKKVDNSKYLGASGLLERLLPKHQNDFIFKEIQSENDKDVFEIISENGKVQISGNDQGSMASGLNWYLRYYCHVRPTWDNFKVELPEKLPEISKKIRKVGVIDHSFYLNYCTYNYTMSFWDWKRWEQEIDFMALNGIDMPLVIIGSEAVWQNTLKHLGYSNEEILKFLPGPAFNAWWLMGNLEGWGGTLTQDRINEGVMLQNKILERMKMYGMKPVVPAFYGMVPNSLIKKYPYADIRDQGLWAGGFQRPAFLNPTNPLFSEIAKIYYNEQEKLFGKFEYYSGDPFHEGGSTEGIDVAMAGKAIYDAMRKASPNATWVLQAWSGNPSNEILSDIPENDVLILDYDASSFPQWEVRDGWKDWPFVWGTISNFGGNVGMFGRLDVIAKEFSSALQNPALNNLQGLGIFPEGAENNPVVYELMLEMKWRNQSPNLNDWLNNYAHSRYGKKDEDIEKAWQVLRRTVYGKKMTRNHEQQGTSESVFCARPSLKVDKVSTWGTSRLYYNPADLLLAWDLFVKKADNFSNSSSYQYDLVDVTRQVLANYGQEVYRKMITAYTDKNESDFAAYSNDFIQLIKDQDKLLNTKEEFMLGPWLDKARAMGKTQDEKNLYEFNARTLVTTWSFQDSNLHEYSHREWGGMLKTFYLPRWEMFIKNLKKDLQGVKVEDINFYKFEEAWNKNLDVFPITAQGNPTTIANEIYTKYFKLISDSYKQ